MSSRDRNTEGDPSSLSGAQKLAEMIRQYWFSQGVEIQVYVVPSSDGDATDQVRYEIRSNLRQDVRAVRKMMAEERKFTYLGG